MRHRLVIESGPGADIALAQSSLAPARNVEGHEGFCQSTQLVVAGTTNYGATQVVADYLWLKDVSGKSCRVGGYSCLGGSLQMATSDGCHRATPPQVPGGGLQTGVLPQGAQAILILFTNDACQERYEPGGNAPRRALLGIEVKMPDGGWWVKAKVPKLNLVCGLHESNWA